MVALTQLLAGFPDFAVAVKGDTANGLRTSGYNFYFQDDIRLRPRFALNVGVRYEYNSPPVEVQDRFSVPDLSPASLTCAPQPDCQFIRAGTKGVPRATYDSDRNNFAPRIGFAWRPLATERFVVRSAYGIFTDVGILNATFFPRFNPPFFEVQFFLNGGTNVIQDILSQPGLPFVQPNLVARDYRDAYLQHWNLDAQYELRPNWVLDLAYVGSKGTHLEAARDLNQPQPGSPLPLPYPQFSSVLQIESRASSIYHALQLRTEKRLSHGLAFLGAYTWSRSIDDVSAVFGSAISSGLPQDSQNARADRGLSDFQAKHRFVFSHTYDLPFGTGRRWLSQAGALRHVFGLWQFSGILTVQSGHPFSVNLGTTQNQTSLSAFGIPDRPDAIADAFRAGPVAANPDPLCQMTISQGGRAADRVQVPESWFNPCAFAIPAGRFGTAGRNTVIAPGIGNFDLSLAKNVSLRGERHRLQLRADFFNVFNHPNFDTPSRTFQSPIFGAVQSANAYGNKPPRQIQVGLKYAF
jgi:hypothetical protein